MRYGSVHAALPGGNGRSRTAAEAAESVCCPFAVH
jgi:hypothetical protein